MALEQDIKIIDLPANNGEFSVVQLLFDGKPVMLCGYTYHSEILGSYLRSQRIQPEKMELTGAFREVEIPILEGPRYKVVGMGRAKINPKRKQFQLPYDASADYGIGPSWEFREKLREKFQGWNTENPNF